MAGFHLAHGTAGFHLAHGTAGFHLAVCVARPATRVAAARLLCVRAHRPCSRASVAAGLPWTRRTGSAPWAGRSGHTSVIDAAGAIYVIGGYGGTGDGTFYRDVWASTDGGARAGLRAVVRGVLGGYSRVLGGGGGGGGGLG